jgi:hypothetical protein
MSLMSAIITILRGQAAVWVGLWVGGLGVAAVGRPRPKGDAAKVALAARLRAETLLPVKWTAERLPMRTPGHASHLLHRHRKP